MSDVTTALTQIDELADELSARGDVALAEKARAAAANLRTAAPIGPATAASGSRAPADVITPQEAAAILGITSVPMVMRWAREQHLDSMRVDGRMMVTRASVERLEGSSLVAHEQEYERELDEVLDAFDAGDEPVPESILPHMGRAPWDSRSSSES